MKKNTCLLCGNELKGRIDKKFCDDQCRTTFNNRLKMDDPMVRNVNNILRKNRTIIREFVPESANKVKVNGRKLSEKGFNFNFFTHSYPNKTGAMSHFCYDYGYQELENGNVLLLRKDPNAA